MLMITADDVLLFICQSQFRRYTIKSIHLGPSPVIEVSLCMYRQFPGYRTSLLAYHQRNSHIQEFRLQSSTPLYLRSISHHCCLNYSQIYSLGSPCQYHYWAESMLLKLFFCPSYCIYFRTSQWFFPNPSLKIDSIVLPFLWDNKTHRTGKKYLCKSKIEGGLGLPHFLSYYWAL